MATTSKQYLDLKGLKSYTDLEHNWVYDQFDGGLLESRVREIFVEMFGTARESGIADDIRIYNTKADFPTTGTEGIQYVDQSTSIEYIWNGSEYQQVNKIAETKDIEDMFK